MTNAKLYSNRATALAKVPRLQIVVCASLINVSQLGRHQEAVEDCSKSLELQPDVLKVVLRRADCYVKLEKYDEAVIDYEQAQQLDRQNSGVYCFSMAV